MAVRSNTDGKLTRTTDLPVNATGWTWCGWVRSTDTEAAVRVAYIVEGAGGIFATILLDTSSLALAFYWNAAPGFFSQPMLTLTDDVPVFAAIKCISATEIEVLWRSPGDVSLSTSGPLTIGSATWTSMYALGSSTGGEEWSNGDARTFKLWHAALSDAEILAESLQEAVVRTANVDSYLTLLDATDPGDDESGNNRDWTASGTFATVQNSTFPGFRARAVRGDGAREEARARRLRPLAAFGAVPPPDSPPGRRTRARREEVQADESPLRRDLSFAAVAQGAPIGIPWGSRARFVGDDVALRASTLELPLRRAQSLAALEVPAPPASPSGVRRPRDRQRGRDRWRGH